MRYFLLQREFIYGLITKCEMISLSSNVVISCFKLDDLTYLST